MADDNEVRAQWMVPLLAKHFSDGACDGACGEICDCFGMNKTYAERAAGMVLDEVGARLAPILDRLDAWGWDVNADGATSVRGNDLAGLIVKELAK